MKRQLEDYLLIILLFLTIPLILSVLVIVLKAVFS